MRICIACNVSLDSKLAVTARVKSWKQGESLDLYKKTGGIFVNDLSEGVIENMRAHICEKCNFQFSEADNCWDVFQTTGRCPKCEIHEAKTVSGKRFVIALISWGLVGFGALFSLMLVLTGSIVGFLPIIAWSSLAVMTYYWLQNLKCHWLWSLIGTFSGIVSAVIFAPMFWLYVWAIPLAMYLVFWHLQKDNGSII